MAETFGNSTLCVRTKQMSSVETGQKSAVETRQMSAVEPTQMSAAETRQMLKSQMKGSGPKSPKLPERGPEWSAGLENQSK